MKLCFSLFLTLIVALSLKSQERSNINFGIGFPITFPETTNDCSSTSKLTFKRIHLFVEKPFHLTESAKNSFSIQPGLGYFRFNEIYQSSSCALGGSSNGDYLHTGLNAYLKLNYGLNSQGKNDNWYFGAIAGTYFYSKTNGNRSWSVMCSEPYYQCSGDETINKSGKDFFGTVFLGLLAGFQLKMEKESIIKPSFEFSFYPNFYTIRDEQKSIGMFTILLGMRSKKEPSVSE